MDHHRSAMKTILKMADSQDDPQGHTAAVKEQVDDIQAPQDPESNEKLDGETDVTQDPVSKTTTPLEVKVRDLTAKFFPNSPDEGLVPVKFLEKAENTAIFRHTIWCFQKAKDARNVELKKWSATDDRFRGLFMTLGKLPDFKPLYDGDDGEEEHDKASPKPKLDKTFKLQAQAMHALLVGIFRSFKVMRKTRAGYSLSSFFTLQARLLNRKTEYWTGRGKKYHDTPHTAGLLSLKLHPSINPDASEAVVPISASLEDTSLNSALEGKFKLMLAQLLSNITRTRHRGDQIPDQEVYLIGLHGSRLHLFRALFPGKDTSLVWSKRYKRPSSAGDFLGSISTSASAGSDPDKSLRQHWQLVEKLTAENPDKDPNPRSFRVLGSQEYDLWVRDEFRAAIRLLVGLFMYLMSGKAHCGVFQFAFKCDPSESDDEKDADKSDSKETADEQELAEAEKMVKEMEEKDRKERELHATFGRMVGFFNEANRRFIQRRNRKREREDED